MARGTKGCCALCVKEDGKVLGKSFDCVMRTRSNEIPLISGKASYQTELYALVWGMSLIPNDETIKVWTNSVVIKCWITSGHVPDDYDSIFHYYEQFSIGRNIKAEQVNLGKSRTMCKVRDYAIELMDGL